MAFLSLKIVCIVGLCLVFLPKDSLQGKHEKRLINKLLGDYQALERPVADESKPIIVWFGLTLQQIIDVDEKNQIIISNCWLDLNWTDSNLVWNPAEYGNVTSIRIHPKYMWTPDVLMYNSADESFDGTYQTNVIVYNDGSTSYIPPGMFKSTCKIDITWFPFDKQECIMKFGSWTYDGTKLDLRLKAPTADLQSFYLNGEWDLLEMPATRYVEFYACCPDSPYIDLKYKFVLLRRKLYYLVNLIVPAVLLSLLTLITFAIPPDAGEKISFGVPATRNVEVYECCPEPYIDIKFKIIIQRRVLFFMVNLIIPTLLITSMVVLLFALPAESGEKISLAVTILLSLTVFLLMVAEQLPSTSDAVPLLGMTVLLSLTVFLLLVAENLPRTSDAVPLIAVYFGIVMMLCALSVIFTVWVLSYHHRSSDTHDMPRWVKRGICEWMAWLACMKRPGHDITRKGILRSSKEKDKEMEMTEKNSKSLLANVLDLDDESGVLVNSHMNGHYPGIKVDSDNHNTAVNYELRSILRELRTITDKMRDDDEAEAITGDWKFAAAVVDRYLFVVFSIASIVSSTAVLLSAPTIFI